MQTEKETLWRQQLERVRTSAAECVVSDQHTLVPVRSPVVLRVGRFLSVACVWVLSQSQSRLRYGASQHPSAPPPHPNLIEKH